MAHAAARRKAGTATRCCGWSKCGRDQRSRADAMMSWAVPPQERRRRNYFPHLMWISRRRGVVPPMRIGFLFNHDQIHQMAHSLPVAMALARANTGAELIVAPTHDLLAIGRDQRRERGC